MIGDPVRRGGAAASAYLLWLFAIRRLPRHPWLGVLSILAIGTGVALLCAVLLLYVSLDSSSRTSASALDLPAALEIVDPSGAGPHVELLSEIRGRQDVRAATPIVELQALATLDDHAIRVTVIGADASIAELDPSIRQWTNGPLARSFQSAYASRNVLRSLGAAPDAIVRLGVGGRYARLRVTPLTPVRDGADDAGARFVVVPLEVAQWLARKPERATSILVAAKATDAGPAPGSMLTARLARELGGRYLVLSSAFRADEVRRAMAPVASLAIFCALLALAAGACLVFNTTSMSIRRELPQVGLLLAMGDRPLCIVTRAVTFAAVLGILGSALGLVAGVAMGERLVASVPAVLQGVPTGGVRLTMPPWPFAWALTCGVLAAATGALLPMLALLRVLPADAMRGLLPKPQPRRRPLRALLPSALALAAGFVAGSSIAGLRAGALGAAVTAPLFLAPALLRGCVGATASWLASTTAARASSVLQVVSSGLRNDPTRNVATAIAAMLSTALVVAIGGATHDVADSVRRFAGGLTGVSVYVSTPDDPFLAVGMDPDTVRAVSLADGIAGVMESTSTFVWIDGQRFWLRGDDPAAIAKWSFAMPEADQREAIDGLAAGGILVSTQVAHRLRLRRGDAVLLPTPAGPAAIPVVATFESWSWPTGTLVVASAVFKRYFGDVAPSQLAVETVPGWAPERVAEGLRRIGGVDAITGTALQERVIANVRDQLIPFDLVRTLTVLMTAIVVLNTCLIAMFQRRREIGILRSIGMSRSQLLLAVMLESGVVLGVAGVAGVIIGVALQVLGIGFVADATGLPLTPAIHVGPMLEGLAASLVAAALGSIYPAWRAAAMLLGTALAYE